MSLDRARQLVNSFNDGDFDDDIEPYFNDLITFFKFVKKYGLLDELDLGQVGYRDWDDEIIEYLDENGVLNNLSYDDAPDELKNVLLLRKLDEDYENTILFIINNLLTDVQIEIVRMVANGMSNAEIAAVRQVTEKSIEQTLSRILKKTNIEMDDKKNRRVELALYYLRQTGVLNDEAV